MLCGVTPAGDTAVVGQRQGVGMLIKTYHRFLMYAAEGRMASTQLHTAIFSAIFFRSRERGEDNAQG